MARPQTYKPKFGFDIRIKPDAPRKPKVAVKKQRCAKAGCKEAGEWRVPKSRDNLEDRHWLCSTHLRDHNEHWNYFAGMSEEEIARHCIEATLGHRPTWPLGRGAQVKDPARAAAQFHVEDGYAIFEDAAEPAVRSPRRPRLTKMQLDSLNTLFLEESATLQEIKARYKELVKRYHPDANGGDRGAEERLKQVIKAYSHLRASGLV